MLFIKIFCPRSYQIRITFKQIYLTPLDGTRTDTTTPAPSGPGSNGKERIFYSIQISKTDIRYSLVSYQGHSFSYVGFPSAKETQRFEARQRGLSFFMVLFYSYAKTRICPRKWNTK